MSRRYNVRYFRRAKRNAERHVRGGRSNVVGGSQQIAYTYEATQACVIKSILLSLRKSLIPRISSKINCEEIVTSRTPIGSLSL